MIGNANQLWSLERFHGRDVGREVYGLRVQWIFGNDGFHEERQFQDYNKGWGEYIIVIDNN